MLATELVRYSTARCWSSTSALRSWGAGPQHALDGGLGLREEVDELDVGGERREPRGTLHRWNLECSRENCTGGLRGGRMSVGGLHSLP